MKLRIPSSAWMALPIAMMTGLSTANAASTVPPSREATYIKDTGTSHIALQTISSASLNPRVATRVLKSAELNALAKTYPFLRTASSFPTLSELKWALQADGTENDTLTIRLSGSPRSRAETQADVAWILNTARILVSDLLSSTSVREMKWGATPSDRDQIAVVIDWNGNFIGFSPMLPPTKSPGNGAIMIAGKHNPIYFQQGTWGLLFGQMARYAASSFPFAYPKPPQTQSPSAQFKHSYLYGFKPTYPMSASMKTYVNSLTNDMMEAGAWQSAASSLTSSTIPALKNFSHMTVQFTASELIVRDGPIGLRMIPKAIFWDKTGNSPGVDWIFETLPYGKESVSGADVTEFCGTSSLDQALGMSPLELLLNTPVFRLYIGMLHHIPPNPLNAPSYFGTVEVDFLNSHGNFIGVSKSFPDYVEEWTLDGKLSTSGSPNASVLQAWFQQTIS